MTDPAEVLGDHAAALAGSGRRVLLGLVGPPGVGKSTLAAATIARLGECGIPAVALPMDGFHLPQAELVRLGRRERMGAPDTFDVAGFVATLTAVRADDGTVRAPLFDRDVEEPVPDALEIPPETRIVIVEGNYLLHDRGGWEGVPRLLDAVWALRLPDAIRRERLIARHVASGKSPEAARAWALGPDEENARLIAADVERHRGAVRHLLLD